MNSRKEITATLLLILNPHVFAKFNDTSFDYLYYGTNITTATKLSNIKTSYDTGYDIDSSFSIDEEYQKEILVYNKTDFSSFLDEITNSTKESVSYPCYSDLLTLNNKMYMDALTQLNQQIKEPKEYIICPNTILSIPNTNKGLPIEEMAIVPTSSNTSIKCGQDGDMANRCIVNGGMYQILFHPKIVVQNVYFFGLQFVNNVRGVSVAGWGHPLSSAFFYNCRWFHNRGYNLIELNYEDMIMGVDGNRLLHESSSHYEEHADKNSIVFLKSTFLNQGAYKKYEILADSFSDEASPVLNDTSYTVYTMNDTTTRSLEEDALTPSMSMGFYNCIFQENEYEMSLIMNTGGILEITNSIIENNYAKNFIIGTVFDGNLLLKNKTLIQNNTIDNFHTIFIDSTSSYLDNDDGNNIMIHNTISVDNDDGSVSCTNGIFIEDKSNSLCLYGKQCIGSCCDVNDNDDCVPIATSSVTTFNSTDGLGTLDEVKTIVPQVEPIIVPVQTTASSKEVIDATVSTNPTPPVSQPDECDKTCIIIATVIPVMGIMLSIGIIIFIKRRSSGRGRNFFTTSHQRRRDSDVPDFDSIEFM